MENIKKSFKKFIARKIEKICAIDFYRTKKWENPCYKILQDEKTKKSSYKLFWGKKIKKFDL